MGWKITININFRNEIVAKGRIICGVMSIGTIIIIKMVTIHPIRAISDDGRRWSRSCKSCKHANTCKFMNSQQTHTKTLFYTTMLTGNSELHNRNFVEQNFCIMKFNSVLIFESYMKYDHDSNVQIVEMPFQQKKIS